MSSLIEITGSDIAALNDSDLRTLVGLLCEAEYRLSNLSTSGITFGGHQDASDGGLDVVIESNTPPKNGFITRSSTGFQVKKPIMRRQDILKEMKPKGELRDEIKSLINNEGAYVIVSSGDSTTTTKLKNRKDAMLEAVKDEKGWEKLLIDFYDRDRLASWTRAHPALIIWVRNKIGKAISGWQTYDNWSNSPEGIEDEYLCDDRLRLHDGTNSNDTGLSIFDGINHLRDRLNQPHASVRLAGLSGVGKTRLAQALFDERVGVSPLNKLQVIYTDISDSPAPEPGQFAKQLIAGNERAVLVIDNCSKELHERLTKICSRSASRLSLLTVEYDVRDHLPEETFVFRLEPASDELITEIVEKRYPYISQVDSRSIAEFSGGNARIAIALANTIGVDENISGLRHETLFERLFYQRNEINDDLMMSACTLSLVYSFDGVDTDPTKSELAILGAFFGKSSNELYRAVAILKERELVQARSKWRAVLPHAIANRLAKKAFELIPKEELTRTFLTGGSERLLQSFTRRLSYLHDCNTAVEIVNDWLKPDGWIGSHVSNLNQLGLNVLKNVAPVAPEKTLALIEWAATGENGDKFITREHQHSNELTRLIRLLAYERTTFQRCARILCRYALTEAPDENVNSIRSLLKSLFYIYLSGTHATAEERASVIKELLSSNDENKQQLGLQLLDAALEAWHFSSHYEFSFGARPRDYGYQPKTREDEVKWFSLFINLSVEFACSKTSVSDDVRKSFANHLRGLWTKAHMHDALIEAATKINAQKSWSDGWIAVKTIRYFDTDEFREETKNKLSELERMLNPENLLDRARAYLSSNRSSHFTLDDLDDLDDNSSASSRWNRAIEITKRIGEEVGQNKKVFHELLPELVTTDCNRIIAFGEGLAQSAKDLSEPWDELYEQFYQTPKGRRRIGILIGYLGACRKLDGVFFDNTLETMITDHALGEWFPTFQTAYEIDEKGLARLHLALNENKADIYQYQRIAYGRSHEILSDGELIKLLKAITSKDDGEHVAIEILKMRFHKNKDEAPEYSTELLEFACGMLASYSFSNEHRNQDLIDYDLSEIAETCLQGELGKQHAQRVYSHIANHIENDRVYPYCLTKLLKTLATLHSITFLDCFIDLKKDSSTNFRFYSFERRENPIHHINDEEIISWLNTDLSNRWVRLCTTATLFKKGKSSERYIWRPFVYWLMEHVNDVSALLKLMSNSIMPSSWSGSLADILARRQILFSDFFEHSNDEICSWAKKQHDYFNECIVKERERESRERRAEHEAFE